MQVKFYQAGKEKRSWLRRIQNISETNLHSGDRVLRPVLQGFGHGGWSALIHWSQPNRVDGALDRALGWEPRAKKERIGQVAEFRQIIICGGFDRKFRYIEAGARELVPYWKNTFESDLLLLISRDGTGAGSSVLEALGWKKIFEDSTVSHPSNRLPEIWAFEVVPGALTKVKTPMKPLEMQQGVRDRLPKWFLDLKPADLAKVKNALAEVIPDPRVRKARHCGIGPLLAFIGLARKCGYESAASQLKWLKGIGASTQSALGFTKRDCHGTLKHPTLHEIKKFTALVMQNTASNRVATEVFNEWLGAHGITPLDDDLLQ